MTRTAAVLSAALTALLGLVVLPTNAFAADPNVTAHLSSRTVTGGQLFTVTSHANVLCDWVVDFRGQKQHTVSRSNVSTFLAPEVTRRTRLPLVVTCVLHSPPAGTTGVRTHQPNPTRTDVSHVAVRIPPNTHVEVPVTVVPPQVSPPEGGPGGEGTGLPSTGGPAYWMVLVGLGAVLLGSVLVRRRPFRPRPRSLPASPG